jgi:hypothetical protein
MSLSVDEASLDFALAHIVARGDTDIVPPAWEFRAIFDQWPNVRSHLASLDLDMWVIRPHRTCLSPKRGLGFRIATQLDPLDTLLITALVFEAGDDLEAARVPIELDVVHSHRFAPDASTGVLYRPDINYQSFRERSLALAKQRGGVVLATDVADFFPRVYHHPLENAVRSACTSEDHARVIHKFLSRLNQSVSHGVPVGPAVVRLLSEVTINDVDRALLSEGYEFCRYSDDYRIFVTDEGAARKACAFLARVLMTSHGLTLQESKTEIVPADEFVSRFERTEEDELRQSVEEKFDLLVGQLKAREERGLADSAEIDHEGNLHLDFRGINFLDLSPYIDIDFDDLTPEQQELVNSLNLWEVVAEQIAADGSLDVPLTRFALKRIFELKVEGDVDLLFGNLKRLYPVFPHVVRAIVAQAGDSTDKKVELGGRLLALLNDPIVGHLEYHRAWILAVFAGDASWNHADNLVRLYDQYFDSFTRCEVINGLGTARVQHWFRTRKAEVMNMTPWERRAFLAGARCLPNDEAKHWFRSVLPQLDLLETAVADWARAQL